MTDRDEKIAGAVFSVVFSNPENGYCVLRLDPGDGRLTTVVGDIPFACAGEELSLTGSWIKHPSYGEQFKAFSCERRLPSLPEGILRYLSSGAVRGVGPVTAKRIVESFGTEAFSALESPEKLARIPGITLSKAGQISSAFKKLSCMRRLMDFLSANLLPPALAMPLYSRYGSGALDAVRENPYILTGDGFFVDFSAADAIALRGGVTADAPARVEAGVLYELFFNLQNGHVFIPVEKLVPITCELLSLYPDAVEMALDRLAEADELKLEKIAGVEACYLKRMHEAEQYVADRLFSMSGVTFDGIPDRAVGDIERRFRIEYAPLQREAISLAAGNKLFLLTGGPGTGKTTALRGIIEIFENLGLKTFLCAPTGRAAKRLSEVCGREASTIHRLLGCVFSPTDGALVFQQNESNPLKCDAVILDEASMVDLPLICALLSALPEHSRLVIVGDPNQLPSVGPGNVLGDILRCGMIKSVCLSEIFRQASESRIVLSAHAVNRGELPELSARYGDFYFIRRPDLDSAARTIVELCAERLPSNMGFSPPMIQVLSPTKLGPTGTVSLNIALQEALNPSKHGKNECQAFGRVWREGDRVMQVRNDYNRLWTTQEGHDGSGVFNGDIGTVLEIRKKDGIMLIRFDDRLAEYELSELSELEHAFCMTVHKSQGSEYPAVVLAASPAPKNLMTRRILYTAITRARDLLVAVGSESALRTMVANNLRSKRYTALKFRIEDLCREA